MGASRPAYAKIETLCMKPRANYEYYIPIDMEKILEGSISREV